MATVPALSSACFRASWHSPLSNLAWFASCLPPSLQQLTTSSDPFSQPRILHQRIALGLNGRHILLPRIGSCKLSLIPSFTELSRDMHKELLKHGTPICIYEIA